MQPRIGHIGNQHPAKCPLLVIAGMDWPLELPLAINCRAAVATSEADIIKWVQEGGVDILIFGPHQTPTESRDILLRLARQCPERYPSAIILNAGPQTEIFSDLVAQDRIFYLARGATSASQVCALIEAGVRISHSLSDDIASRVVEVDLAVEFCARMDLQIDLRSAGRLLADTVGNLIQANRVRFLVFDKQRDLLYSLESATSGDHAAAAGLVGYIARTHEAVRMSSILADPRYDKDIDDPDAYGDASYIGEPVLGTGAALIGVLTAARNADSASFTSKDAELVALFVACAAPTLSALRLREQLRERILFNAHSNIGAKDMFRREAIEYHAQPSQQGGDLLLTPPRWLLRAHWLVLLLAALSLLYMVLAKVDERATGSALIRARGKVAVTAVSPGFIRSVEVSDGQRIHSGDPIAHFVGPPAVDASERLEEMHAPISGIVRELRVRPGEKVTPGDPIASIVSEPSGYDVFVFLPGFYAPQLRVGMTFVLRVEGYGDSHEVMVIDNIASAVIDPREAAQSVGKLGPDVIRTTGPIIIVKASLRKGGFEAKGRFYRYHDGMVGSASVILGSDPLLLSLMPSLRSIMRMRK